MLHFARSTEHFPLTLTLSKREYLFSALPTCGRSADFQSAVSPNCIRQGVGSSQHLGLCQSFAECNSAIQQSTTLRYGGALNTYQGEGTAVAWLVFSQRLLFDRLRPGCDREPVGRSPSR